jgi:hypothetical protein
MMITNEPNETPHAPYPRPKNSVFSAGMSVIARTIPSGEEIDCTIKCWDNQTGQWELLSPAHGYTIMRTSHEIRRRDRAETACAEGAKP